MVKIWTKEEENMLSKIHHMYTNAELAEIFGVTTKSISIKKKKLNLINEKEETPEGYKKCNSCNSILPVSEFQKRTRSKDGLQSKCKTCRSEYARKIKIDLKNKNKDIERKDKIKKYVEERQGQILFCEACNEEKKIDDYYIYVKKEGSVGRECFKCKERRSFNYTIKRMKEKGY